MAKARAYTAKNRRKHKLPAILLACLMGLAQVQSALAQIVNSVVATGTYGGVTVRKRTTATVEVVPSAPRISLFKTGAFNDGGDGKADAGDTISYRFTVSNTGNVSLSNITVTDPLVNVIGGPITTLQPGSTDAVTFSAVYQLTQADVDAGTVSNTASVSGTDPGGTTVSAIDGETTALVSTPGLALAKAGSLNDGGDGRADAGDTIFYQFVVTNIGPTTLTDVKITDPLLDFASRASAARALAQFDGLLAGSDPIMTASTSQGLRSTIIDDDVSMPDAIRQLPVPEAVPPAMRTQLPPVPMSLRATRRLIQLSGETGNPQAGDRIGILYSLTNTGDAAVFDMKVRDVGSDVFNDQLDQLSPGETDTGGILFTRQLSGEELQSGAVLSKASISAYGRNQRVVETLNKSLPLAGIEHADTLQTAAISPAAVSSLAPGGQTIFTATYTLTQADIDFGEVANTAVASGTDPAGATLLSVDTATVSLAAQPSIALVKVGTANLGTNSTATLGDVIDYRFAVTNTGNVTLTDVQISDALVTVNGGPIASLAPGATDATTFTASHTLVQADLDAGQVENQATATGSPPTGLPVTDLSDDTDTAGDDPTVTTLTPTSSIALVKNMSAITDLNSNGITDAGDQLNYTFTVTNTGNVSLTGISVTDPLVTVTGGPIASLAPGQTNNTVFRATYVLTQADVDAGELSNQATATATDPAGTTIDDLSNDTLGPTTDASGTGDDPTVTPIPELADIALIKAASSVTDTNTNGVNDVGDIINYAFTVTNIGNVTLSSVSVNDPLVTVLGGPLATLAPGASDSTTFTASYTITSADAAAGRVTNQATASGVTPSGRGVSDLSDNASPDEDDPTITAVTRLPAIALLKTVDAVTNTNGNAQIDAGDTVEYVFTVYNTGNVALTNVVVTDPLVTIQGGPISTLDPGRSDSTTFTASYTLTNADVVAGRVTNQATAFGTGPGARVVSDLSDGESTTEDDPTITLLASAPGIALVKSVSSITDTNSNGVTDVGDIIVYAFAVTNTGNVALSNVVVSDPKVTVAGGPIASLGVSQTNNTTFTANYTITQADVDAGGVSNQATASGTTPGNVLVSDLSDESAIDGSDPTVTPLNQQPGIALVKTVRSIDDRNGNGNTDTGDVITYAFSVTNTGNLTLSNVTVSDPLVAVNGGPLVTLAPGATDSTTFTADYTITLADAVAGRVSNQATVSSLTPGGTALTDLSDDASLTQNDPTVTPVMQSQLSLAKTALITEIRRGETVPFIIIATAVGTTPLLITDIMPPGFTYVVGSASVNGARVKPVIDGRSLRFDNLMPDAAETISLKLTLRAVSSSRTGRYINRAELRDVPGALLATARAAVTIIEEHVFDCGDVIGRVFDDKNRNGYADAGEPGLPGVRVVTVKGLLVTTDKHGRFHVPCADIPDAETGSNFVMKLDVRTLPSGYHLTSENPRVVRLTRGKVTKLNFGASIYREVALDLKDEAFAKGKLVLRPEWHKGIARLIQVLEQEPSVLNISYRHGDVGAGLAGRRLAAVKSMISSEWQRRDGGYRLVIDARAVGVE